MTMTIRVRAALLAVLCGVAAPVAAQQQGNNSQGSAARQPAVTALPSDNYDELFRRYLDAARTTVAGAAVPTTPNWVTDLFRDPRALRPNDLVTVQVIESISAVGAADSSLSKDSSASVAIPSLLGLEARAGRRLNPSSLIAGRMSTDFKGQGATTRSGELFATMTARVSEVLPNGDLVLEGAREIDINGDRQMVVLTGVVRTVDIGPNNVVLSPSIGQLRIRYFGRGLIKDNLRPGWLIRVLNRLF
jgi:flagellar L-ring protein FlgH